MHRLVVDLTTGETREVPLTKAEIKEVEKAEAAAIKAEEEAPADESLEDQIYRIVDEALKERGQ